MDEIIANTPQLVQAILDAISNGEPLSVAAFARLTGTGENAVVAAWKTGRLPSVPGGKIPIREGIIALVSCGGLRKGKIPAYLIKADEAAREALGYPPRDTGDPDDAPSELAVWRLKYLKAQTAARAATAQARQMQNDLEKGLDAAEAAVGVAGALARIPERAAGMCVGCTAEEIAVILRREIAIALEAIQTSAFTGDWGGIL